MVIQKSYEMKKNIHRGGGEINKSESAGLSWSAKRIASIYTHACTHITRIHLCVYIVKKMYY